MAVRTLAVALLSRCAFGLRRHRANATAAANVEYYGRFDFSVPGQATFDWPGTYIEGGFMGTSLSVNIDGLYGTRFDVFIDGQKVPAIMSTQRSQADEAKADRVEVPHSLEAQTCGPIDSQCGGHVGWAYDVGKWEYPSSYAGPLRSIAGISGGDDFAVVQAASFWDFQRIFFCGAFDPEQTCSLPPCECSNPPCDTCGGTGTTQAPAPPPTSAPAPPPTSAPAPPPTSAPAPATPEYGTFELDGRAGSYDVAAGLSNTAHTVRLVKRSENRFGTVTFKGFSYGGGYALPAPARPALKLEFVGDSNTAGYGAESPSKSDPSRQDESGRSCSQWEITRYTNTDVTWGATAARILGAQYSAIAQSGLGMVRHYGGDTSRRLFKEYYTDTLMAENGPAWDSSSWTADVVVIRLGTNDFTTPLGPNDVGRFANRSDLIAQYKSEYRQFLSIVRARNPGAKIINAVLFLWPDDEIRPAVQDVIAQEEAAGATDLYYQDFVGGSQFGCDYHLDKADHERLGQEMAALIASIV